MESREVGCQAHDERAKCPAAWERSRVRHVGLRPKWWLAESDPPSDSVAFVERWARRESCDTNQCLTSNRIVRLPQRNSIVPPSNSG
jgi:hypothetical protein